jgi:hypothetical protein
VWKGNSEGSAVKDETIGDSSSERELKGFGNGAEDVDSLAEE